MQLVCPAGENLLQYIRKKNIQIPALCAGNGSCGKCRIRIAAASAPSIPSAREKEIFSGEELDQGWRLACLQRLKAPVRIEIPEYGEEAFEILTGMQSPAAAAGGEISECREKAAGIPEGIQETQERLRPDRPYGIAVDLGTTTLALALTDLQEGRVVRTVSALNRQRLYGADVISRIQAAESGELSRLSGMVREDIRTVIKELLSPLVLPEKDGPGGEREQGFCRKTESGSGAGGAYADIRDITIAANTAMIHLLLGLPCGGLGTYPFRPLTLGGEELSWKCLFGAGAEQTEKAYGGMKTGGSAESGKEEAGEAAESVNEEAGGAADFGNVEAGGASDSGKVKVHILRGISSYVGADITAGIYALDLDRRKGNTLFLDLGTNGEMALIRDGRISCASAAAGPALEGGNLSCGTGSIPGAVCGLEIRGSSVLVRTIGGKAPIGFCGSGVIETAAALLEAGLMDRTGRLREDLREHGFDLRTAGYLLQGDGSCSLAEGEDESESAAQRKNESEPARERRAGIPCIPVQGENTEYHAPGTGRDRSVCMTQDDIRQLQLAKAAIRAGIEILLDREGLSCDKIDRVFLAGAFGTFLNPQKAAAIGLIPEELARKALPAGNTSLAGAVKSLCESAGAERIRKIAEQAEERILANESGFEELFIRYMDFPDRRQMP